MSVAQLLLTQVRRFYCFRPGPHIFFKHVWHNNLCCPDDGRSIYRNIASLNRIVHDVINLLYYEQRTGKPKYIFTFKLFFCCNSKTQHEFFCKFSLILFIIKGTLTQTFISVDIIVFTLRNMSKAPHHNSI